MSSGLYLASVPRRARLARCTSVAVWASQRRALKLAAGGARKSRELEDYEAAVEIEHEHDRAGHALNMRRSPLPSLFKYMPPAPPARAPDPAQRPRAQLEPGPSAHPDRPPPKLLDRQPKENAQAPGTPERFLQAQETAVAEHDDGRSTSTSAPRRNPVGVQLLSEHMHQQVFPGPGLRKPPDALVEVSKQHLAKHGLSPAGAATLPEVSFDLPPLEGGNIREHFHALGSYAAEPYLSMAKEFAQVELPPQPAQWETSRPGWTRYAADGSISAVDDLSGETLLCFDVETLYKLSPYPVMATAASPDAWYSWLSPSIFESPPEAEPAPRAPWDKATPECYPHTLIPLFSDNTPAVVVGHNVGYDRARVADEYALERTPTRWLDTLSLHVATRGITSVQRPAWMKHRKAKVEKATQRSETMEALRDEAERTGDELLAASLSEWSDAVDDGGVGATAASWEDTTSVNSLADVAALHCGTRIDKAARDRFADTDIRHASQLRPELSELLSYCATDVQTTHEVYKVVLPLFLASCPHPATFAGVLAMGNSFLPVDRSWENYLRSAETMYQDLREDVRVALRTLADRLRRAGPDATDPWSSQLDWSEKPARWAEGTSEGAAQTVSEPASPEVGADAPDADTNPLPAWYAPIAASPTALLDNKYTRYILPLLLRMTYRGYPVYYVSEHYWCIRAPIDAIPELCPLHGAPVELSAKDKDAHLAEHLEDSVFFRVVPPGATRRAKLVGKASAKDVAAGLLASAYPAVLDKVVAGDLKSALPDLERCAQDMLEESKDERKSDWAAQLDWAVQKPSSKQTLPKRRSAPFGTWPKWYWDLTVPVTNKKVPPGQLDLTMRKSVAPLLLRMQWQGYPLAHSKEHKWVYRVPKDDVSSDPNSPLSSLKAVKFSGKAGDERLVADKEYAYFRVPHKDGEGSNVGNPLSKAFLKAVEKGDLSSALANDEDKQLASAASTAVNMNALCSYWISSRERIMNQFVVYDDDGEHGMILPQVITMGTVTRRAVEATWLTASNAKKNRVGSELKSMVRAPPGYAIVGADVDSQELWISSVMGDSQFGMHGATAIGWMTLEGTKSAGTDLHSKTASILNISRDAAKVFNYSRIYGAGKPHAIQLLLQGDGKLSADAADDLATSLYRHTKGAKTFRSKGKGPAAMQYVWHGGSESYLFNTLEAIALMERPTTPALGCGVTRALRKSFLDAGHSYLPSRINWVVQSSGVDYLHLLITSMEYLVAKYGIQARYLLSVHDEVRYLAAEEDKLRAALALQIANVWTRALFCYNLGLDDMPQGIAFFSAVDIDRYLRKETDMPCVTPSHAQPLPPGESLDIAQLLARTDGGAALGRPLPGHDTPLARVASPAPPVKIFDDITHPQHLMYTAAQSDARARAARTWIDALPATAAAAATAAPQRRVRR